MFEVGENFDTVALGAHVIPRGEDALHVVGILDDFVVPGFNLRAGGGLGEVDLLSTDLSLQVSGSLVAALVVRAGDVSGRSRERERSTLRAKHG